MKREKGGPMWPLFFLFFSYRTVFHVPETLIFDLVCNFQWLLPSILKWSPVAFIMMRYHHSG